MKIAVVGMGPHRRLFLPSLSPLYPHKVLGTTRNHKTVEFALSVGAH